MSDADIPRVNLDAQRDLAEPEEREANEALYAGQLVVPSGGGVSAHATDGSRPPLFYVALDARQRGLEWGDDYPTDSKLPLIRPEGGYLNLPLAAGESVAEDDYLVPDGSGGVRAAAGDGTEESAYVGIAEEAVDNSGGTDPTAVPTEVIY